MIFVSVRKSTFHFRVRKETFHFRVIASKPLLLTLDERKKIWGGYGESRPVWGGGHVHPLDFWGWGVHAGAVGPGLPSVSVEGRLWVED